MSKAAALIPPAMDEGPRFSASMSTSVLVCLILVVLWDDALLWGFKIASAGHFYHVASSSLLLPPLPSLPPHHLKCCSTEGGEGGVTPAGGHLGVGLAVKVDHTTTPSGGTCKVSVPALGGVRRARSGLPLVGRTGADAEFYDDIRVCAGRGKNTPCGQCPLKKALEDKKNFVEKAREGGGLEKLHIFPSFT